MTPRDIFKEAIAFRCPPYVPWSFSFTKEASEKLEAHYGTTDLEPLLRNHIVTLGSGIGYFDPPWTPSLLRRNEVMLRVDQ
jgi:uroporphyrinogen decarboxylase